MSYVVEREVYAHNDWKPSLEKIRQHDFCSIPARDRLSAVTVVQDWLRLLASIVPASGYMFLFDVRPEADRRILRTSSTMEVFESLENLKRVRRKTLSLVSTGNWRIIDGNKAAKDVERAIADTLRLPF
ncbi:MAG: hypothetical protein ABSG57_02635 [Candidatus Bathyarchaeia archaeon]